MYFKGNKFLTEFPSHVLLTSRLYVQINPDLVCTLNIDVYIHFILRWLPCKVGMCKHTYVCG